MKAIITKIESVNGGAIWSVTINATGVVVSDLDISQLIAGEPFADGPERGGKHWFHFWSKPELSVGDAITDGDEPVIAEAHGEVTQTEAKRPSGPGLEEVWCEKHGLKL